MKSSTRSSFLTPLRADRATAASDIVVCVAADDLRRFTAAAVAHHMSVYASSACLDRNALRPNIAQQSRHFLVTVGPAQLSWRVSADSESDFRGLF